MESQLATILSRSDTALVPMNETVLAQWTTSPVFVTHSLNSCTAVAIVSNKARILAHIAPSAPPTDGTTHLRNMMRRVIAQYNEGFDRGLFPSTSTSVIVAGVWRGNVALPEQIQAAKAILERLSLPVNIKQYTVQESGYQQYQTSVMIQSQVNRFPVFFINGEAQILHAIGRPETQSSRTSGETSTREDRVRTFNNAYTRLIERGQQPAQAVQTLAQHLEADGGRTAAAAQHEAKVLRSIGNLVTTGMPFAAAVAQLGNAIVEKTQCTTDEAMARIDAVFEPTRRG